MGAGSHDLLMYQRKASGSINLLSMSSLLSMRCVLSILSLGMNIDSNSNAALCLCLALISSTESKTPERQGPTHLSLNPCAFLPSQSWVQKAKGGISFVLYLQATGWDHPICLECNFGLKEPELMEEPKQLNPDCFSFHCPYREWREWRSGSSVNSTLVPLFEVWTMDNFNCTYKMAPCGQVHAST